MTTMPYAEDVNYWQTGSSAPDTWIDRSKSEIRAAGGTVISEVYGSDNTGRAAYLLEFSFNGKRFRAVWPVLKSKTKNEPAARIQAATMLYHDVKTKCVSAKVHGVHAAFFQYAVLPDGRTAAELAAPDLSARYPKVVMTEE
jgi:hypothetical protein